MPNTHSIVRKRWSSLPQHIQDQRWPSNFRMYEDTFEELLALCQPYLPLPQAKKEHEQAFRSYTRKMQLLVAVYCLAHIPTLRMVSEHFSMPHNSVSVCCIKRGVSAIVQALYRDANVIRWPRASSDLAATCRKFEFEHRLRGCCGAIDGTTIPMRKPTRRRLEVTPTATGTTRGTLLACCLRSWTAICASRTSTPVPLRTLATQDCII